MWLSRREDAHFVRYPPAAGEPCGLNSHQGNQNQNKTLKEFSSNPGDLGGSRTRVVGMKTRCTNRYTTRPYVYYNEKSYKLQEYEYFV